MPRWRSLRVGLLALGMAVLAPPAQAGEDLNVGDWLARPGVRLVALEFYSTACPPCMKAMPRWAALKQKYYAKGLRVLVVRSRDEEDGGRCPSLGWSPDDHVCDLDGVVTDRFGVQGLPAAFLWSWQGNLLVQRGHIDAVEREVARYLDQMPRVKLAAQTGVGADVVAAVKEQLVTEGKVTVIADSAEAELAHREKRAQQANAGYADNSKCEIGEELAANSVLRLGRVGKAGQTRLALELLDLATVCPGVSVLVPWDGDARRLAVDGVAKLLGRMRQPRLQMPGAGKAAAVVAPPERKGPRVSGGTVDGGTGGDKGPEVGGGAVTAAVGELIVTVQPKDAFVEVSGPKGFKATGRGRWESKALAPGAYTVKASAEGYESKTATAKVEVDEMTPLKVVLDKLGALEVTGTPAGAKVEIAGPDGFAAVQGLPVTVGDAPKGQYKVTVSKAGFETETYAPFVQLAEMTRVVVALKPAGSLVVEGTPVGAQVEISGPGGFAVTKGLPVTVQGAVRGTYRVKVTREGYGKFEATAEVKAGETATVVVKLEKARVVEAERSGAGAGAHDRAVGLNEVEDPPEGSRNATAYRDHGNGTVWDAALQVTWQRGDSGKDLNWADAKTYCANLELVGGGWRLPSIFELLSLVDRSRPESERIAVAFQNSAKRFWTASPRFGGGAAWVVIFYVGYSAYRGNTNANRVRCVR